MSLRRDHLVGVAGLALAAIALALSTDLPVGTLASPGPGMLPLLAIGLIALLSAALAAAAHASPPLGKIDLADLRHAAIVSAGAAAAALVYERLGFVITALLMLLLFTAVVERLPLWRAVAYSAGIALGLRVLLGTLLKSPLPIGPLGF